MQNPLSLLTAALDALTTRKGALLGAPAVLALAGLLSLGGVDRAPAQSAAPAGAAAPAVAIGPFSADQTQAIQKIIKDYLMANPDVIMEVQQALEAKMEAQQAEKIKSAIKDNADEIFRRSSAPVAGNPKGDVTVVEFFDYNCGYCKRGFAEIAKLIDKDKNVKLVLKELPILSKGSEEAARVALAAKAQGKYWEVHRALLESRGQANEAAALKLAERFGLDMAKLKKDMDSAEVKAEIQKVRELAQKMGIQGTPHFLIGDKSIPGAPDNLFETMSGMVADLRKTGCQVC
jgi:protein-disulfide isomerase